MSRALELAQRGDPSPNPHVGSRDRRRRQVLGEGFHQAVGLDHARGRRAQGGGGQSPRQDAVRHARALQPRGPHAAVRRRDPGGGHQARRDRLPRSEPARCRAAASSGCAKAASR